MDLMKRLYPVAAIAGLILGLMLNEMIKELGIAGRSYWMFWAAASVVVFITFYLFVWNEIQDVPTPIRFW